jgi:predicted acylesterase/phospholipase RssA
MSNYKNLVLSGGALKSTSFIGCFKYMEENKIDTIQTVIGSSAGAMMGLLYVLGFNSSQMRDYIIEELKAYSVSETDFESMFEIFTTLGIDSGTEFSKMCEKVLNIAGFSTKATFSELAKRRGKNLVVCGSNLTLAKCEYFGVDTTPDMEIVKAIRISISLPILFTPIIMNDMVYVDACIFNHNPIDYFTNTNNPFIDTIALVIGGTKTPTAKDLNLFSYMQLILLSMLSCINDNKGEGKNNLIIPIDIFDETGVSGFNFDTMKFNTSDELLEGYIELGYSSIVKKMQQNLLAHQEEHSQSELSLLPKENAL